MIFVFDDMQVRTFHMANCLIDLDIIFCDQRGTIVHAATMTAPAAGQQSKRYSSMVPARFAIELPAGTCRRLGIGLGMRIEIPGMLSKQR